MIPDLKKILLLVSFLVISANVFAQRIVIEAIEISSLGLVGQSKLPTYSQFLSNTRDPVLFRTQEVSEIDRKNKAIKSGFNIDFIFRSKTNDRHQFITGFEASNVDIEMYEVSGKFMDSLAVSTSLNTRNEFFFLKAGYQYVRTPQKKFTFLVGATLNVGIPVSAKTDEIISGKNSSQDNFEFSYFSKQSASLGIVIPFGIRFKVVNNFSISLKANPTFHYQRLDGTGLVTSFQGSNLGFHFKIRD